MSAPRVAAGVPAGGQFATNPRDEPAVDLIAPPAPYHSHDDWPLFVETDADALVEDWEADLAHCGLSIGQWAEHGDFRVRLTAHEEAAPDSFTSGERHPHDGGREPDHTPTALDLEVQVRDTHADAGEPDADSPGWATPRSAPAAGQRIPSRHASNAQGRGRLAGFMLRQLNNSIGDLEAAWKDMGRLIEDSTPQVR